MGTGLTSRYTLVIHEVTSTSVKVWLGALFPSIAKPHHWRLRVLDKRGNLVKTVSRTDGWERPFDKLKKRFYTIETIHGLPAGKQFTIEFETRSEKKYILLERGYFRTLPNKIPNQQQKPFTIGVGSCFYSKHDGGQVGQAYQALYEHKDLSPDIKFLTGDQVYLDIGLGWYPLDATDVQDRIADDYAESWELLRSMLRRGGTWMLADDHEYWNNYPYLKGFNPYLVTLDLSSSFRKRWEHAAQLGVSIVQQIKPIRTFDIGKDLSVCIADLRTERWDNGFLSNESFKLLSNWAKNLTTPGVLAIPQPLIAEKGGASDYSLPHWEVQYNELLQHLSNCDHDIVVLTGDVHYGRIAEVKLGNSKGRLIEVITSPMSNLSELNGFAASTPETKKRFFPLSPVSGVPKNRIKYRRTVTTESKWWDLRFPKKRTTEHFMTVGFQKSAGQLSMTVNAWDARKFVKATGLPKRNFKPLTFKLA